jgi:cholesterol transport system auxiliary component
MTVGLLLVCGCTNLSKSFPDKQFYALETKRTGERMAPVPGSLLKVRHLRSSPQYEGRGIVYRQADFVYESDFYHEWFIPPAAMITTELERWLDHSGAFTHVVSSSNSIQSSYVLEGAIRELYADYRENSSPKVVLGLEIYLMKVRPTGRDIIYQHEYHQALNVQDRSPKSLAFGWNEGLQRIFMVLEKDLRSAVAETMDGIAPDDK